jgi:hypothetical protein
MAEENLKACNKIFSAKRAQRTTSLFAFAFQGKPNAACARQLWKTYRARFLKREKIFSALDKPSRDSHNPPFDKTTLKFAAARLFLFLLRSFLRQNSSRDLAGTLCFRDCSFNSSWLEVCWNV